MPQAMNDTLRRIQQQLVAFSVAQRVIGILLVIGLALGGFAFFRWASAPTYAPLFGNLAGEDASAIVDKLDADGVKYQLTDGGATVMVPKDLVYSERVKLSGQGLPASSEGGYSLLDKQGVTASQFQQQVTYQRALEGELAKTVQAISGVSAAVVHLAIPAKDVFLDDQSKPTASVLVSMKPGAEMSSQQVQSVVHLVASSIEGMSSDDVTVVDGKGNLLSTNGSVTGTASGGATNDQLTQDYENRQAGQLQAVLDKIVGPGHAVAQVNATLQFDSIDTTTERVYTDKEAKPLATSTTTEKYAGGSGSASGVLGTDNLAVPSGSSGSGSYEKSTTTTNNAQSKVTEHKKATPGSIVRQSVSVVVDDKTKGVDLTKLESAVRTAAGIDTTRGDALNVTSMPFDQTAAKADAVELKKAEQAQQRAQMVGWAKQAGITLVVLIVLLMLWLSWRKRKAQAATDDLMRLDLLESQVGVPAQRQALEAADRLPALGSADDGPAPAIPQRRKDDVLSLVERQPEEVAELLRGWLADRRG
ncbi:flagellar basal-body MS-ring/collar protein FliF [Angustibacter sp. McL0619]|uniref:flagellar basal-body MS-ring/collar protein FliF n=1 Tax=Angustibacter sp. McL0619 TaxID=3415676 RepID=UPI003CEC774E